MQATDCWGTRRAYVPRQPERAVLHRVVREHLETFLAEARHRGGGEGVPLFVERELREFLTCGVLARGFARFRCHGCLREILVAFSCKGRGFCPSCCGRRMAERAAHLTDGVLSGCADKYQLRERIRFETEVEELTYDERAKHWTVRVRTQDGRREILDANAVISAVGQLNRPRFPEIPGRERFTGIAFHSPSCAQCWATTARRRASSRRCTGAGSASLHPSQMSQAMSPCR